VCVICAGRGGGLDWVLEGGILGEIYRCVIECTTKSFNRLSLSFFLSLSLSLSHFRSRSRSRSLTHSLSFSYPFSLSLSLSLSLCRYLYPFLFISRNPSARLYSRILSLAPLASRFPLSIYAEIFFYFNTRRQYTINRSPSPTTTLDLYYNRGATLFFTPLCIYIFIYIYIYIIYSSFN